MVDLPDWAVERVARRMWPTPWESRWDNDPRAPAVRERDGRFFAAALAEFLAIIEERGLRIVPADNLPDKMRVAGLVKLVAILEADIEDLRREHGERLPWQLLVIRNDTESEAIYREMLEAAPPLAELLEDRADG